jgi:hypothetical protein
MDTPTGSVEIQRESEGRYLALPPPISVGAGARRVSCPFWLDKRLIDSEGQHQLHAVPFTFQGRCDFALRFQQGSEGTHV